MKRWIAWLLVMGIISSSVAYAMPTQKKQETVYVNLDDYGSIKEMNIYQQCVLNGTQEITDYTSYEEVTNLTNHVEYRTIEEGIDWDVSGESYFSYTGRVGEEYYSLLPWTFEISYQLNGVEVSREELLGKSGLVTIQIKITANHDAAEYYRNHYLLEITGSYDMSDYLSVESDEAMITNSGNTKTLMFLVLPGQSTELSIRIGAEDFQMDGITMAMVPLTGDWLDKVAELAEDKQDIEDAMDAMNQSTNTVLNAMYGMTGGLTGISAGVTEIKEGMKEIHGLQGLRDEDIETLKTILQEVIPLMEGVQEDVTNLSSQYHTLLDFVTEINSEVEELQTQLNALEKDLKQVENVVKDLPETIDEMSRLLTDVASITSDMRTLLGALTGEQTAQMSELTDGLEKLKAAAQGIEIAARGISEEPAKTNIAAAASGIEAGVDQMLSSLGSGSHSVPGAKATDEDLSQLSKQLRKVANLLDGEDADILEDTVHDIRFSTSTLETMLGSMMEYSEDFLAEKGNVEMALQHANDMIKECQQMSVLCLSVTQNLQTMLDIVSSDVYNGSSQTTDALLEVNQQLLEITKESPAIRDSKNQVKDIVDRNLDKIEEETTIWQVDKEAEVVSFGSPKNEHVESVQFLLKTPDIKKKKEEKKDMEEEKPSSSFFARFLVILQELFGWITKWFAK